MILTFTYHIKVFGCVWLSHSTKQISRVNPRSSVASRQDGAPAVRLTGSAFPHLPHLPSPLQSWMEEMRRKVYQTYTRHKKWRKVTMIILSFEKQRSVNMCMVISCLNGVSLKKNEKDLCNLKNQLNDCSGANQTSSVTSEIKWDQVRSCEIKWDQVSMTLLYISWHTWMIWT